MAKNASLLIHFNLHCPVHAKLFPSLTATKFNINFGRMPSILLTTHLHFQHMKNKELFHGLPTYIKADRKTKIGHSKPEHFYQIQIWRHGQNRYRFHQGKTPQTNSLSQQSRNLSLLIFRQNTGFYNKGCSGLKAFHSPVC